MDHSSLSEKLDQITTDQLGLAYDEDQLWDGLERRLNGQTTIKSERRWLVSACLFLAVCLLPFTLLKENTVQTELISFQTEIESMPLQELSAETQNTSVAVANKYVGSEIRFLEAKNAIPSLAEINDYSLLPIQKDSKSYVEDDKPKFSKADISIIQSSLKKPSIRKEKKVIIRAQRQPFTRSMSANDQSLKVKLTDHNE